MYCHSLDGCLEQVKAYIEAKSIGYPLIVNTENFRDYQQLMDRFEVDSTKQCIYVSDHTLDNGLPDIPEVLEIIKGSGCFVLSGISQSVMLRGEEALDAQISELISLPIKDHAVIMLCQCRPFIEKYLRRDQRVPNRCVLLDGEKTSLPKLIFTKNKDECLEGYDDGIKDLLSHLERMTDYDIAKKPTKYVVSSFSAPFFSKSMYAASVSSGVYDALIKRFPDLGAACSKSFATENEWAWLFDKTKKHNSFSSLIVESFGSTADLGSQFCNVYKSDDEKNMWLLWVGMKVFGSGAGKYLAFALEHSVSFSDLVHHIYQDILDVKSDDSEFELFFRERKQLVNQLPENLPEISAYCTNVGRHGKKAVFYLTDSTEDEKYTFMRLVAGYDWTDEELLNAVEHGFPELALYMKDFVFDLLNTKLPEQDAEFRNVLTAYFQRYKIQKIKNHIEDAFLEQVNQFALDRPFYKIQPRSSIVNKLDREKTQAYFFDALGVEYLSYIQAKCKEYGLIYDIRIGHCELPSITGKNKEFQKYFETRDISDLDELKHHSQEYDYQKCEYPTHVFRELEIINEELRKIRSFLIQNKNTVDKAVILSDHGASRLAVIYKQENQSLLEMEEKGQHSGRCCPCEEDPHIPQAAYEDGYAVLANYERFRGSRKANVEVHGGASLEEVLVPIITIALKPDNVQYYFVDSVVKYKMNQPTEIELFSNVPMNEPRLEVEGTFYTGEFRVDKNHAVFRIDDLKRARKYTARIYEGGTDTGYVLTFDIERGTKTRDLFGL